MYFSFFVSSSFILTTAGSVWSVHKSKNVLAIRGSNMRMITQALVTIWIIHHQASIAFLGKEGLNGVMASTANS